MFTTKKPVKKESPLEKESPKPIMILASKKSEPVNTLPDHELKFVLIGHSDSGKNALLRRYFENSFYNDWEEKATGYSRTLPRTDFKIVDIEGISLKPVLEITRGEKDAGGSLFIRYNNKGGTPSYFYASGHVAIVLFDLKRMKSFNDAKSLIDEVRYSRFGNVILVGTKSDELRNEVRDEAIAFVNNPKNKIDAYIETSAKTGENVSQVFDLACKLAFDRIVPSKCKESAMTDDKEKEEVKQNDVPHKESCRLM